MIRWVRILLFEDMPFFPVHHPHREASPCRLRVSGLRWGPGIQNLTCIFFTILRIDHESRYIWSCQKPIIIFRFLVSLLEEVWTAWTSSVVKGLSILHIVCIPTPESLWVDELLFFLFKILSSISSSSFFPLWRLAHMLRQCWVQHVGASTVAVRKCLKIPNVAGRC